VPRFVLVLGALAFVSAFAFARPASAQTTQLLPGVTYQSEVEFTPFGPVALHIVRAPRPVGPYRLQPELSNNAVEGRERLSAMERRLSSTASVVGVNGDFFAWKDGRPSGITLRDDVLITPPNAHRSSAGITSDGTLDIRRVALDGTWQGTGPQRTITSLNRAPDANGIALFTSDWGPATPRIAGSYSVVLLPFSSATPNAEIQAPVVDFRRSQAVPLEPGLAVLVARGSAAQTLEAEAPLGATLTVDLALSPGWETVTDAIGGGPVLVRDGKLVSRADEWFTPSQLLPREPRSAVGQTADGRILLVAVDGRRKGYSVGLSNFGLAQELAKLGAVQAMAFDSGGSTTLAFDGKVMNRPSNGGERPISTALMLLYSGVYVPPPRVPVVSPNDDGVDDSQRLSFKVVRPSTVTVTLTAPDKKVAFQETAARNPGTYRVAFPPLPAPPAPGPTQTPPAQLTSPAEGTWTLAVAATDDEGVASSATQKFSVNETLGFLRLAPRALRLPQAGGKATVTWKQTRAALVTVAVTTPSGTVVGTIAKQRFSPGDNSVTWGGRRGDGVPLPSGSYLVRVSATNELGTVSLAKPLRVRRVSK
jgi:hypothetical protein